MKAQCMAATLLVLAAGLAGAVEFTFDSRGTEIHYTIDGVGEPVILVHGYTSSSAMNWRFPGVVNLLDDDYRVIAPDVRGHGKSAVAADGKYGVEMVHDVARLMDHLGIEKAHIVGYSMGGMIAIKFATLYPERVKSAVVGGMGWVNPGSMGERGERYAKVSPVMAEVYDDFNELETTEAEMKALSMPLTVIVGTKDEGQLRRVERWQQFEPDLSVVYVEGASHASCVIKPEFRGAIKDFIDSNP